MAYLIFVAYILAVIGYGYFAFSRKCESLRFKVYKAYLEIIQLTIGFIQCIIYYIKSREHLAEQLCGGLQNRVNRCNSYSALLVLYIERGYYA